MINLKPFQNYTYLPPIFVRETNNCLNALHNKEQKYIIYMGRIKMQTRIDKNHKKVCEFLKDYADKNKLIFIDFEHQNYNVIERFNLFEQAKIVIYIHGGAGFNIYFCPQKINTIIEFNFCASTKELKVEEDPRKPRKSELFDVLEYVASPIGFNFFGIVVEKSSKYSKYITIPIEKLKEILK